MFGFGFQELLTLGLIIVILNVTGIWPIIMRSIRELRGEPVDDMPPPGARPAPGKGDLDLCYRLLGVSSTAHWDEVERAYRLKAKKHHPDLGGDEDAMRTLNEAYTRIKKSRGR